MMISNNNIEKQLKKLKSNFCYSEIGTLISKSLKVNSSEFNRQVFGYIPAHFREIEIYGNLSNLNIHNIFVGEPILYKVFFPSSATMGEIRYFYLFCYLKDNDQGLNVFFQSASRASRFLCPKNYYLSSRKIAFEGMVSAFENDLSFISISDPGHFIPGLCSSFYVGTTKLNFTQLISTVVEKISRLAKIKLKHTFLFGSSAGGMGALLSSTYFSSKVQVMSLNSQISTYHLSDPMKILLGTDEKENLLYKFGDRVCCFKRFQNDICSIPNIFLSANTNDSIYQKNYKFYQLYRKLFSGRDKNNQSLFDSYCGVNGHGRPDKKSLKKKIYIARELLTLNSNPSEEDKKLSMSHNDVVKHNNTQIIESISKKEIRKKYIYLADSLMQEKSFREAFFFYHQASIIDPNHSRIHASLGNALLNMGESEKAIDCYRRAIEIKSNYPGAFKRMGDAFRLKGDLNEAILCYQKALKLKPSLSELLTSIANILAQQQKNEEAQKYFDAYQKLQVK